MNFRITLIALMLSGSALGGCESVGDTLSLNRKPLTLQQQAALAVGSDYRQALLAISPRGKSKSVAAPEPLIAEQDTNAAPQLPPAPASNSFGPRIGQYFLVDDYVVYRHALPQEVAQAGPVIDAVTGEPVPAESDAAIAPTQVRLTYFLVSPKGIVDDYALGTLSVSTTACLQIISGQVVICDEPDRLSEDFDLFDAAMRTSKFQPLDTWNVSANANVPVDEQNAPVIGEKPTQ